jgi:ABC-type transporter Mla MlaB component
LLSKMVKFVKSPTTHWADLDREVPDSSGDTESRLALKEMIERKRRNDFVRNREFDMLRKLRRKEALTDADALPGPSYFPSGQPANEDERERTLKKIDEIEAQMSTAWIKRKGDQDQDGVAPAPAPVSDEAPSHEPLMQHGGAGAGEVDHTPLAPSPVAPQVYAQPTYQHARSDDFAATEPMNEAAFEAELARIRANKRAHSAPQPLPAAFEPPAAMSVAAQAHPVAPRAPAAPIFGSGAFLDDMADFQVEVAVPAKLDPEIEEAAIRYANGDAEGAEAGLLELLAEGGRREDDADTWLTLFDLYRATGARGKFDDMALQFAARFGRSAPQFGRDMQVPAAAAAQTVAAPGRFQWVSPVNLGVQSLAAMRGALARSPQPWRLDWRKLNAIELSALLILDDLFKQWASEQVQLRFLGGDQLLQVLAEQSLADDRSADPQWWSARLNLLRLMGEMDQFDLVALSYCVTYEVSPPAWEDPVNNYAPLSDEGHTMLPEDDGDLSTQSTSQFAASDLSSALGELGDGLTRSELTGELLGSAEAALHAVRIGVNTGAIELNCRTLRRVDFAAAGDLLNWSMEQRSGGRAVAFKQVNRLVAAFFGVIGITETARVVLRAD